MQRPQVAVNVKPIKLLDTLTLGLGVIHEIESVVKHSPVNPESASNELRHAADPDRPGVVP